MSHLHVEECPQVMKIRHNLQLNIPESRATPHTEFGPGMHHQAKWLAPTLLPALFLLQYSSCLQEAADSRTAHHTAPCQILILFYVFSGLHHQPKPLEENEDYKQISKKKQNSRSKQTKMCRFN